MSSGNVALVAGGLGVIGRALVDHFAARDDWDVIGLSRRSPDFETAARYESVDLQDVAATRACLGRLGRVTHVFYAAYQEHKDPAQATSANLGMLQTLCEATDVLPNLRRVVLYEGVKYYGVHLGLFKTPAKEADPRHLPPNFYYDQEDYLRAHAEKMPWGHGSTAPRRRLRLRGGQPDEPDPGHRRVCRDLQGAWRGVAVSRLGRCVARAGAGDRRRTAGACVGIRRDRGPSWRSIQRDERRPVPLGTIVPGLRARLWYGAGIAAAVAAGELHGRQAAGLGADRRQAPAAAIRLRHDRRVGFRRFHLQLRLRRRFVHDQAAPGGFCRRSRQRRNVPAHVRRISPPPRDP